jgi:hypothetical protein
MHKLVCLIQTTESNFTYSERMACDLILVRLLLFLSLTRHPERYMKSILFKVEQGRKKAQHIKVYVMQFGVKPAYIGHLRPLGCLMAVLRASKRLYDYI